MKHLAAKLSELRPVQEAVRFSGDWSVRSKIRKIQKEGYKPILTVNSDGRLLIADGHTISCALYLLHGLNSLAEIIVLESDEDVRKNNRGFLRQQQIYKYQEAVKKLKIRANLILQLETKVLSVPDIFYQMCRGESYKFRVRDIPLEELMNYDNF